MIPLCVPNISGKEREYLNNCIDTTFVSSVGEYVDRIEEMTAEAAGTGYGVATSSGTTGLHLALLGMGVGRDDIVIMPTFTFIATANAVSYCGACPWLMDIDPNSWTISTEQVENEISENTIEKDGILIHKETGRRIAAIMPVYTLGNVADMDRLRAIADKYNLPLIADAAAALGAKYKGKDVGKLADLTVFSFNGNKTVTAGGGGMIVGNDEMLMKKLKHLSTTARVTKEYDHDMVGYNYRMTNVQAAIGCAQLERLDEFVDKKRYIRKYYGNALSDVRGISFFPVPGYTESSCWFSGIVLNDGSIDEVRKLCGYMNDNGIECRSFWKPVHLQKPYTNAIKAEELSYSEGIYGKIMTLPCSTGITEKELQNVVYNLAHIL